MAGEEEQWREKDKIESKRIHVDKCRVWIFFLIR